MIKRVLDIVCVVFALAVLAVPICIIAVLVRMTSPGPAIYWSERVGRGNAIFTMPKFRTMRVETPTIATHLLTNAEDFLTPIGTFLRRSSLDEIPQLWCILKGNMSIVGPRPALYNQNDLIELRTKYNIHTILPGLTGWAQVNGRDSISIPDKVAFDVEYLRRQSLLFDLRIILLTAWRAALGSDVNH